MTDVLVTSFAPTGGSGAGLRTVGVIRALAAHGEVLVRYVSPDGRAPDPGLAADPRVTLERVEPEGGLRRAARVLRTRAAGVPTDWARAASDALVAAGTALPAGARLIADGPTVGGALLGTPAARDGVYLAHNLETAFREGRGIAAFEGRLLVGFHETWMCTERDVAGARERFGAPRLRYVPNVVDTDAVPVVVPPAGGPPTVLLVADLGYAPNRDGLDHLVDEILPWAWATEPALRVLVVGRGLHRPLDDPRIEAPGFVEDLDAWYARAHAVVVPLRVGGGSPLKFVEALAHGLPVVTTPHAAALLERGEAGRDFLVGADAPALADLLVSAATGEHRVVGERGRALAEREYSVAALSRLVTA